MRSRGLAYGFLIIVAVVVGVIATGMPNKRNDPTLRVPAAETAKPAPRTSTSVRPHAPKTSTTTAAAHDPTTVTVLVANASGVTGAATKRGEDLKRRGYVSLTPVDAQDASATTRVLFLPGAEADAVAIARVIAAPAGAVRAMPDPLPVRDLQAATVLVVLGKDLAS